VQAGSSLGILIPPSVVLVLYAMIARQPVIDLWLAGIGPGLLMAVLFGIYVFVRCLIQPEIGPALPEVERAQITMGERLRLLRAGILPLAIFAVMMTLFLTGVTSLVESSAVGAGLAALAAWWAGNMNRKVFEESTRSTLVISAMFLWIILGALCFSSVYDGLGAVRAVKTLMLDTWDFSPWTILVLMLFSFIIMGMFLDDTAMLVIVAPLYIPLVRALEFDLIWYGILYTITCQIAYITPPFGYNLFLMRALAPDHVSLGDIYRSIVPIVGIMILTLAIIMAFPQIALWLPAQVYGQ
jgi:tripartite ATP-independent transporter DctM subunit